MIANPINEGIWSASVSFEASPSWFEYCTEFQAKVRPTLPEWVPISSPYLLYFKTQTTPSFPFPNLSATLSWINSTFSNWLEGQINYAFTCFRWRLSLNSPTFFISTVYILIYFMRVFLWLLGWSELMGSQWSSDHWPRSCCLLKMPIFHHGFFLCCLNYWSCCD